MLIKNWSASPSGGAITINGTDDRGAPVKLRGVKRVEPRRGKLWGRESAAIMGDGTAHRLA